MLHLGSGFRVSERLFRRSRVCRRGVETIIYKYIYAYTYINVCIYIYIHCVYMQSAYSYLYIYIYIYLHMYSLYIIYIYIIMYIHFSSFDGFTLLYGPTVGLCGLYGMSNQIYHDQNMCFLHTLWNGLTRHRGGMTRVIPRLKGFNLPICKESVIMS